LRIPELDQRRGMSHLRDQGHWGAGAVARVLLVWSAGVGAASFSPTPGGIGVVEVTMTAALVASGLHGPQAVAAVLFYRIVNSKFIITTVCLVHRWFHQRRTQFPARD